MSSELSADELSRLIFFLIGATLLVGSLWAQFGLWAAMAAIGASLMALSGKAGFGRAYAIGSMRRMLRHGAVSVNDQDNARLACDRLCAGMALQIFTTNIFCPPKPILQKISIKFARVS